MILQSLADLPNNDSMSDFPNYGLLPRILGSILNLAVQLVDHVVGPALISAETEGRYREKPELAPQPTDPQITACPPISIE